MTSLCRHERCRVVSTRGQCASALQEMVRLAAQCPDIPRYLRYYSSDIDTAFDEVFRDAHDEAIAVDDLESADIFREARIVLIEDRSVATCAREVVANGFNSGRQDDPDLSRERRNVFRDRGDDLVRKLGNITGHRPARMKMILFSLLTVAAFFYMTESFENVNSDDSIFERIHTWGSNLKESIVASGNSMATRAIFLILKHVAHNKVDALGNFIGSDEMQYALAME